MNKIRRTIAMLMAAVAIALGGAAVAAPAAQAYTWTNCYVAMNGTTYCYKNCTYYEMDHGCYDGWYAWNYWYA